MNDEDIVFDCDMGMKENVARRHREEQFFSQGRGHTAVRRGVTRRLPGSRTLALQFDNGAQLSAPGATNEFGSGRVKAPAGAIPTWAKITVGAVGVLAAAFLLTMKRR